MSDQKPRTRKVRVGGRVVRVAIVRKRPRRGGHPAGCGCGKGR
jgi:hypothetical protein